jgi:uncharacterized protein YecA (UPF0149 family)
MTMLCTCEAQLQPHDWMLNVCPEPREVHDRELEEWRELFDQIETRDWMERTNA